MSAHPFGKRPLDSELRASLSSYRTRPISTPLSEREHRVRKVRPRRVHLIAAGVLAIAGAPLLLAALGLVLHGLARVLGWV